MLMSTKSMDEYVERLSKRESEEKMMRIPDVTMRLLDGDVEVEEEEESMGHKILTTASGIEKTKLDKLTKRLRNLAYTLQIATLVEYFVQYMADLLRSFDFESPILLICRIYFICWGISLCFAAIYIVRLTRNQIQHVDENILTLSRSMEDIERLKTLSRHAFRRVTGMVPLVFLACIVVILWGLDILISNAATYEGYVAAIIIMFTVDTALVFSLAYRVLLRPFEFSLLVEDSTTKIQEMRKRKVAPSKQKGLTR